MNLFWNTIPSLLHELVDFKLFSPFGHCYYSGSTKEELFQDRFVGEILAGYSKTLLFLEAAIRASLASQPILTMHDLEMILVGHPVFGGKARFEDALAGQLQFHPLVKEAFGLEHLHKIPDDFPVISSVELMGKLFSPPILREMLCQGKRFSGKRSRSVLSSLSKLASEYSLGDWRLLGPPSTCVAAVNACHPRNRTGAMSKNHSACIWKCRPLSRNTICATRAACPTVDAKVVICQRTGREWF